VGYEGRGSPSEKAEVRFKKFLPSRNLNFTREETRQREHLILKRWKRGGLEDFSRTKEDEMTAANRPPSREIARVLRAAADEKMATRDARTTLGRKLSGNFRAALPYLCV